MKPPATPLRVLAAQAVIRNPAGHLLLLESAKHPGRWLLPGGDVPGGTNPHTTCTEHILRLTGGACRAKRLLAVDFVRLDRSAVERVLHVYSCTEFPPLGEILPPPEMFNTHRWVSPDSSVLDEHLPLHIRRRVSEALTALATRATTEMANGYPCPADPFRRAS